VKRRTHQATEAAATQKRSCSAEKTCGQQTKEQNDEPSSQNTQHPTSHSLLPCITPYSYSNSNSKTVEQQKQQTASQASGQ
jgi:hypothetical protein